MSMPPNEPHFVLMRAYDRYSVMVRDERGNYQKLLTLENDFNWQPCADMILDALVSTDPAVMPDPNAKR